MGIDHFSVTQDYLNALEEKNVGLKELSFTSFPAAGLVSTFDYGSYITDSSLSYNSYSYWRENL